MYHDTPCVCDSLQEVSSRPLRFVSDSVFDDPWSKKLMETLSPRRYVKVPILPEHLTRGSAGESSAVVFFTSSVCLLSRVCVCVCLSVDVHQDAGSAAARLLQTEARPVHQRHPDHLHAHRRLRLLGEQHTHAHANIHACTCTLSPSLSLSRAYRSSPRATKAACRRACPSTATCCVSSTATWRLTWTSPRREWTSSSTSWTRRRSTAKRPQRSTTTGQLATFGDGGTECF